MVKIDKFGKIFLPKHIRSQLESDHFQAIIMQDELHLIPIKDPSDLFGSLKGSSMKTLEEIHDEEHDVSH